MNTSRIANGIRYVAALAGAATLCTTELIAQMVPPSGGGTVIAEPVLSPPVGGTPEPIMLAVGGVAVGAYYVFRKVRSKRDA